MCVCFELCLGYLGCKANLTLASIEFWAMASHMEFLRTLGTEGKPEGLSTSEMHGKLEHAITHAENTKKKAFEKSVSRWKAKEDAMEALCKAVDLESLCMMEMKERKEMEEVLAGQKKDLESTKNLYDQYTKELQMVHDQKQVLESKLLESCSVEDELEEKILEAVNLLMTFKEKQDKLQIEHDKVISKINGLRKLVKKIPEALITYNLVLPLSYIKAWVLKLYTSMLYKTIPEFSYVRQLHAIYEEAP